MKTDKNPVEAQKKKDGESEAKKLQENKRRQPRREEGTVKRIRRRK